MKKTLLSLAIFVLVLALNACDHFYNPLKPYIEEATSRTSGLGMSIEPAPFVREDGSKFISPKDESGQAVIITVELRNPQKYNLALGLEGAGSNIIDVNGKKKASAELSSDKQKVFVKIDNQERLDIFDLTLTMEANGRPMDPYKLPKLECRYLGATLGSLTVTPLNHAKGVHSSPVTVDLSNPAKEFTTAFPYGTEYIDVEAILPHGVYSQGTIGGVSIGDGPIPQIQVGSDDSGTKISIEVTADCGKKATYTLTIRVGKADSNSIIGFAFGIPLETVIIDEGAKTISVSVPFGTDVRNLTPVVTHTGISCSPATAQDFIYPVTYTVTAHNGLTAAYKVTVYLGPPPETTEEFTVTFNSDGITIPGLSQSIGSDGNAIAPSPPLTKTGYIFDYWHSNQALPTAFDFSAPITGDTILYAKWSPITYTVHYDANGGTETMADQDFTYDVPQNLTPNGFTRTGYTFAGWTVSAFGGTYVDGASVTNLSETQEATVTLYAMWTEVGDYTVNYDTSGGNTIPPKERVGWTANNLLPYPPPDRIGYNFIEWRTHPDGGGNEVTDVTPYSKLAANVDNLMAITLYALWTANSYTITYYPNDGVNDAANPESYTIETAAITLQGAVRTGYTFGGWFEETEFLTQVTAIPIGSYGNKTLYAKWTANAYGITFSVQNITDGVSPPADNITISRSGTPSSNPPDKFLVEVDGDYDSICWEVAGTGVNAGETENVTEGCSFELDANNEIYGSLGNHTLILEVEKAGMTYQVNINFKVVP